MLNKLKQKILKEIEQAKDLTKLEQVYRQYLGRKGELTQILRSLKDMPEKERKEKGKLANQIKKEIEGLLQEARERREAQQPRERQQRDDWLDVTAPGILPPQGHLHPITLVQRQIEEIFQSMGFSVLDGPEVETEYYNFDALNVPKNHPAREMWDTFWLKDIGLLLRTHTSPMQARYMEKHNPPLRIIVPGRCFRHEATDATHDVQFYQFEGLMVGKNVSAANFKAIIEEFFKQFFSSDVEVRLRPSYFPFVEPGFEVDVKRKGKDWLEIMGAGMVHPNVFKAVGYIPNKWQGFAFGAGLERLAMIKYQIDDIRLFFSSDLRFLKQF
jgi:phenylalanyl-tRNA synthetase alpha chain